MKFNNQTKAYIYALSAVLFWSTVATAFKLTLQYLNILELLLISTLTSTIFLLIVNVVKKNFTKNKVISKYAILNSSLLGFLNPFLYYLILFNAYKILPAQEALTLNYTWTILIVISSIIILKQKIKLFRILAILISFFGVILIVTRGNPTTLQFSDPIGTSLALISSLIWALYWVYNIKDTRDELSKLFLNFFFGLIYIIIFIISSEQIPFIKLITLSHNDLFSFFSNNLKYISGAIYIGFFEMGLTFFLWLKALNYSETTAHVSNLIFLSPFISLLFIYFILNEKILFSTIFGLIFVIIGILLQQTIGKKNNHKN